LLKDPASVIAVQLLHGLTFAGLYVVGSAYLADTAGGATGFALSLFTAAFNLGGVAGGYLLALVQARYGYTSMYLAAAALSTLSLPLLLASAMLGSRPRATR
jgi:predicted MFS family arabinose efflux permease